MKAPGNDNQAAVEIRHSSSKPASLESHHRSVKNEMPRVEDRPYRTLVSRLSRGVVEVDASGSITFCNSAFARIHGYAEGELIGSSISDLLVRDEDRSRLCELLDGSAADGAEVVSLTAVGRTKDDRQINIRYDWNCLRADGGTVCGALGAAARVADEGCEDENFVHSAASWESILESMPDHFVLLDREGKLLYINHTAGILKKEQIIGVCAFDFLPEPWRERAQACCQRVLETGAPEHMVFEYDSSDGSRQILDARVGAVLDGDEIVGLSARATDVSDHVRAEEKIRRSEERLRMLLQLSKDAILVTDNEGRYVEVNQAACEMFGRTQSEMLTMSVDDLVTPEGVPAARELFEQYRATGDARGDLVFVAPDGESRVADYAARRISDNMHMAVLRDVTERKRAEEALSQSEEEFRRALDDAPLPIMIHADDGEILRISKTWTDLTGWTLQEIPTIFDWTDKAYGQRKELVQADIDKLYALNQRRHEGEYRITAKNGESMTWDFSSAPLGELPDGRRTVISMAVDVTDRKQAEQALREAHDALEARVAERTSELSEANVKLKAEITDRKRIADDLRLKESAIASSVSAIAFTDLEGRLNYVNQSFLEMWGYDEPGDVLGKFGTLFAARNEEFRQILDTLRQRGSYIGEHVGEKRDGTCIDVQIAASVVTNDDGQAIGIMTSMTDVTDRKRTEEKLRQREAALAHVSRISTMGEMATGLAHELNQPLTAIATYADACSQTVESGLPDDRTQLLEWIDQILELSQRAGQIIRRLRGFIGKSSTQRSTIRLDALVNDVVALVQADVRQREITIAVDLEQPVSIVQVDHVQIEQVLVNLLRNAFDAMSGVGNDLRQVRIESARVSNQQVEVRVVDRGVGLSDESFDQLFEPFFSTKKDGMGMGLAISRSIIEAHDGRLWATMNTGPGVTFHFTLTTFTK